MSTRDRGAITSLNDTGDQVKALQLGGDDFISRPLEQVELVARVPYTLRLTSVYDKLDSAEQVTFALAAAMEAKDSQTERHTQRVAEAARHIGRRLCLPPVDLDALHRGGMIHDIGKIGVDDAILRKPRPLDPDELVKMRAHPLIGANIVKRLPFAADIIPIIRHHHERFDGRGYPDGLRGQEIPLHARIVAVCDAYDSLVSDRPYRASCSVVEAIQILLADGGRHWDSRLVTLFVDELPAIRELMSGLQ
jgi:putative two-component system response regulator